MKLCGIMDDEDFMDTDDTPTQVQTPAATLPPHPPPPSTLPPTTYELPSTLNNSASNVMVTIPYVPGTEINDNQQYSFSIPAGTAAENGATAFNSDITIGKSKTNDELIIDQKNVPADRQYMIKIDNNDGTPPYPLSITLPHNMNPTDSSNANKIGTVVTSQPSNGLIHSNQMQINGK